MSSSALKRIGSEMKTLNFGLLFQKKEHSIQDDFTAANMAAFIMCGKLHNTYELCMVENKKEDKNR